MRFWQIMFMVGTVAWTLFMVMADDEATRDHCRIMASIFIIGVGLATGIIAERKQ